MGQIGSCEIKVVDHKTEYIAISAYDDYVEDGKGRSGELNCEYAIIKADDNLLGALKEIKDESNWGCVRRNFRDSSLVRLVYTEFLLFDCSISFFGDNPDLGNRTEIYKSVSPINNRGNMISLENVEGNFDEEIGRLCGKLEKYDKCHVRLESSVHISKALYNPLYSLISFRHNPDRYTDYRTFPVNIDNLIDFIK